MTRRELEASNLLAIKERGDKLLKKTMELTIQFALLVEELKESEKNYQQLCKDWWGLSATHLSYYKEIARRSKLFMTYKDSLPFTTRGLYELRIFGDEELVIKINDGTINKNLTVAGIKEIGVRRHTVSTQLYVMECQSYYKIGVASNMFTRRDQLQTGNPFPITIIYSEKFNGANKVEEHIHHKLDKYRLIGEWFDCDLDTIIAEIQQILSVCKNAKS